MASGLSAASTETQKQSKDLSNYFGNEYIIADLTITHPSLKASYRIKDARIRSYKSVARADRRDVKEDENLYYSCHFSGHGFTAWLSYEFTEQLSKLGLKLVSKDKSDSELLPNEVRLGREVTESDVRTESNGYRASSSGNVTKNNNSQTPAKPKAGCFLQASELDAQFKKLAHDCGGIGDEAWEMLRKRGLNDLEILHLQHYCGWFSHSDKDVFEKDLRVIEGFPGSWWDKEAECFRPKVSGKVKGGVFQPNLKGYKVYNQETKRNEFVASKNSITTAQKLVIVASNANEQRIGAQTTYCDPARRGKNKYLAMSHELAPWNLYYPYDSDTPLEKPEAPIPFYRPIPRENKDIQGRDFCLAGAEGFLKPAIACLKNGTKFLGASSGLQASSPVQFEKALATAKAECPDLKSQYHETLARRWKDELMEEKLPKKIKKVTNDEKNKDLSQEDLQKKINGATRKLNKELLDYARESLEVKIEVLTAGSSSNDLFLYLDCLDAGAIENENIMGDLLKDPNWKRNKPVYDADKPDGGLGQYNRVGKTCHFVRSNGYNYFVEWHGQDQKEISEYSKRFRGDIDEVEYSLSHTLSSNISVDYADEQNENNRIAWVTVNRTSKRIISFENLAEKAKAAQLFKRYLKRQLGLTIPGKTKYEALVDFAQERGYEVHTAEEKDFKDNAGRFIGVKQFIELADVPRGSLSLLPFACGMGKTAAAESLSQRKREESQQMLHHFELGLDYCDRHNLNFLDPKNLEEMFGRKSREYLYLIGRNYRDLDRFKQDIELFKLGIVESFESIYSFGARNALQAQTADRMDIGFKPEIMLKNGGDKRALKAVKSLSLCLDSVLDIEPWQVAGADLLIDEFEGVVAHAFLGSTCKANREKIGNRTRELVRTCLKTGGRVFLMGAGINQLTIEVLEAWFKDDEIPLTYNKLFYGSPYKKEDRKWKNCKVLEGSVKFSEEEKANNENVLVGDPMAVVYKALEAMKAGYKVKFHSDKKEFVQIFHYLVNSKGFNGVLYTSDDGDDTGKFQFIADPNGFLREEKKSASPVQSVASSPVFSSGLSIQEPYFDYVFGVFFGIVSTDDVLQTLSRVRANVDRFVWVANNAGRGMSLPENLTDLDKAARLFEEGQVLKHGKQVFHLAYNQIKIGKLLEPHTRSGKNKTLEEQLEELMRQPDGYAPDNISYESINKSNRYNSIQAKLIADRNRDSFCYRRLAKHKLAELAQNFEIIDNPEELWVPEEFWTDWEEALQAVRWALAQAIANARDIGKEEAMELSKQDLTNIEDKNALRKYCFKRDTHCDLEPEVEVLLDLIINGNGSMLKQIRAVAEVNNPELSTTAKLPEYFFNTLDNEGEVLRADLPPTFGEVMNKLGAAELLADPHRKWQERELNQLFREKFESQEARNQGSIFGIYADRNSYDFGVKIASQLLRKMGFYLNCGEDGWGISTKNNFDTETWQKAYPAAVNRLHQEAYEAVVAVRTHYENTYSVEFAEALDLPKIAPPPKSKFEFVPTAAPSSTPTPAPSVKTPPITQQLELDLRRRT